VADIFTKAKRSQIMSAIRSRGNKETELKFAAILRATGITGWRRHQPLPGRPDFVFRRERVAIFVDGCFWHGCPKHGGKPEDNRAYWIPKLLRNQERDSEINHLLKKEGWRVLRIWEHDLAPASKIVTRIKKALGRAPQKGT
jgi:DNA mismatch endonuclease (patch repair protein)